MRILLSAVGTRGDIQPLLALALELRLLGHQPELCISPNFLDWAERLGLSARPMGIAMRPGPVPSPIPDLIADQFETLQQAAQCQDMIIAAGAHQYAARSISQLQGIRLIQAVYAPQDYQDPRSWNQRSLERVNANRSRLNLPAIEDVLGHILGEEPWLAADPQLSPAGRGAWILHDESPLDEQLQAFLATGQAPVYLGLGSMPAAPGTAEKLIAAVRAQGRRLVLHRGWADLQLSDDRDDCFQVGDVNQQKLFPRCACVVHHGGAGTTHTAAAAGAPQVIVPMYSDQPYWGQRVRELHLGTTCNLEDLAEALREALQQERPEAMKMQHDVRRMLA